MRTSIIVFLLAFLCGCQNGAVYIYETKCENIVNPLGIQNITPSISWKIKSDKRDVYQLKYKIIASTTIETLNEKEADLWNSGWVESPQTLNIKYDGDVLSSGNYVYWKVKVETNIGTSKWSEPALFSIGLLNDEQWIGDWIGLDGFFGNETDTQRRTRLGARYFRHEFTSENKKIKNATAYICGLGLYELNINGKKVGDYVLSPICSEFEERTYYNTFDVTDYIEQNNAIGVTLGNGRYFTRRTAPLTSPITKNFGFPKLILQLVITYEDDTKKTIVSDNTWKVTPYGPIRANNEYDGEEYDARREINGWDSYGYNDSTWMDVHLAKPPTKQIVSQMSEPMRVTEKIKPISLRRIKDTVIFDMGQNMVGWVRLKIKNSKKQPTDSSKVVLMFSENIHPDGSVDMSNLRDAQCTDRYYFKGTDTEFFEPKFVYHGFRYVCLTGDYDTTDDELMNSIEGAVVHDDLQLTGNFECSNPLVNKIYRNGYWGIKGNYNGVPTDCPQRDERLGWMGDRVANSLGESYIFNINSLYSKWLTDINDSQLPDGSLPNLAPAYWAFYGDNVTWPSIYIIAAELLRCKYANYDPIHKNYPSMKLWMSKMNSYIVYDLMTKDVYGDWCVPPSDPHQIHSNDPTRITNGELLSSVYYTELLRLMSSFSKIIGNKDFLEFDAIRIKMVDAINAKYLNRENGYYANNTPTSNLITLFYNIPPKEYRQQIMQNIIDKTKNEYNGHISVGLIGIQVLMRTLTDNGEIETAYKLLTQTTYPSWGYMIANNATTIWELWNGNTADVSMNSGNHVMLLGDLIGWFYGYLGGIRNAEGSEAYKKIQLKPYYTNDLTYVNSSYNSSYGNIVSNWSKSGEKFKWDVEIPANSTAVIYIPCKDLETLTESNKNVSKSKHMKFIEMNDDRAVFEVCSGKYSFTSSIN